jgi:hypothetical protein
MTLRTGITFAFACSALFACTVDKPGERCDGFFSNTCKSPLSCVDVGDKKVCAGSCDHDWNNFGKDYCKDPAFTPSSVEYTKGSESLGSAGCHCLPKK